MKYEIIKSFKGSQDGRFTEEFQEGTEVDLSDYLVSCIPADWVRAVGHLPPKAIPEPGASAAATAQPKAPKGKKGAVPPAPTSEE